MSELTEDTDHQDAGEPEGALVPRHPHGSTSRPHRRLTELLNAYEQVLDAIDGLSPLVIAQSGYSQPGSWKLPRPRWFLRYFALDHIDHSIEQLRRRYYARAALGVVSEHDEADRQAVEYYRQSLPPVRRRTYMVMLIAATAIAGYLVLPWLGAFLEVKGSRHALQELVSKVGSTVIPNPTAVSDALNALTRANFDEITFLLAGGMLVLYGVLRPIMPSFRLKRMLFNLYPEFNKRRVVPAYLSIPRSTGIYNLEESLFRSLGVEPQRERPFDLVVPALLSFFFVIGSISGIGQGDRGGDLLFDVLVIVLALLRLGWLGRTWRRRLSSYAGSISALPSTTKMIRAQQRRTSAKRLVRLVGVGALGGFLTGAIVGGLGGRMIMRIIALNAGPSHAGTLTAGGDTIGRITPLGTMQVVLGAGLGFGLGAGILYVALRPWLTQFGRWRGITFGVLMLGSLGFVFFDPSNPDFARLGSPWINIGLFGLLFIVFGWLLAPAVHWIDHVLPGRMARQHGPFASIAGYGVLVTSTLLGLGFLIVIIVNVPNAVLDMDIQESGPILVLYFLITYPLLYRRRMRQMSFDKPLRLDPAPSNRPIRPRPIDYMMLSLPVIVGYVVTLQAIKIVIRGA